MSREPTPEQLRPVQEIAYVMMRSRDGWRAGVLLVYGEGQKELSVRWFKKVEPLRRTWLAKLHELGDLPVATNRTALRHILWKNKIRGVDPRYVFGLE